MAQPGESLRPIMERPLRRVQVAVAEPRGFSLWRQAARSRRCSETGDAGYDCG